MAYTQRDADYIITKAYVAAQRKAVPPASTTTKYAALLKIVDSEQQDWASEPDTEWNSLYELVSNGTVTATDTFDLDDSIQYVSKRVGDYVRLTSGTTTVAYRLVSPNQLYANQENAAVAQIGRTLKFSKAFKSTDSVFGYTIQIPAIIYPDEITSGSSLIMCDDPMYLVYMTAAEFVRNDTVKSAQYENLLAKAGQRMEKMKQANGGQYDTISTAGWFAQGESW